MANKKSEPKLTGQILKANVIINRKISLRTFENATVSLMIEFFLDKSNHIAESEKLIESIDQIIPKIRKRWS